MRALEILSYTTVAVLLMLTIVVVFVHHRGRSAAQDGNLLYEKREIVEKNDCAKVVKARVYEKVSRLPAPSILMRYENHLVLADGRTEVFDSIFVYEVGQLRCHFWTVPK